MLGESDIIEFMPEGSGALTEPGKYKFVCEQGVFGNEGYEASGYADGLANKRIEVRFTLGEGASVYAVDATGSDMSSPVYYNMQGIRVSNPVPGEIYIVRRGDKVEKAVMP